MSATVFFESTSELATIRNVFKVDGVATDPTTISLTITDPTGTATTYTFALGQITRNGTGDYQKDIACTVDGTWTYEWTGTGVATDVQAGTWEVFPTDLGHIYPAIEALKSRLGIGDTVDDLELHSACFAASRWVEQYCQRVFYRSAAATVRTFIPQNAYRLPMPEFNDLVSVSAVATDTSGDGTFETTWTAADYQLWPPNPGAGPEQQPYTQIHAVGAQTFPRPTFGAARQDVVQITGVYGWASVPQSVRQGALMKAAEIFKLKDAPFGLAGGDDFGFVRIRRNEPIEQMLGPYRRFPYLAA